MGAAAIKPNVVAEPIAVQPAAAAELLGMSVSSFERYVAPDVRVIRRGRMLLYPLAELRAWAEREASSVRDEFAAARRRA